MSDMQTIRFTETKARQNFRHTKGGVPEGIDPESRLYTADVEFTMCGREWRDILAVADPATYDKTGTPQVDTHLYLTRNGFDRERHGPELYVTDYHPSHALYRQALRAWCRDTLGREAVING